MRIWFIHPKYYDKKGLLAQWNEGLILKNIIYGKRNKLTVEKNKKKGKETPVNLQPKAWVNHPFSKRVLRYKKNLQKKVINTYLASIRKYGVEVFGIKFNEKYLDEECIDMSLKVPIVKEQIEKDRQDALDKMFVRDKTIYNSLTKLKSFEEFELSEPFYYEKDFKKYVSFLDPEYKKWAGKDRNKLIGTEIILEPSEPKTSNDSSDSKAKKH